MCPAMEGLKKRKEKTEAALQQWHKLSQHLHVVGLIQFEFESNYDNVHWEKKSGVDDGKGGGALIIAH